MNGKNIRSNRGVLQKRESDSKVPQIGGLFVVYNSLSEPIFDWMKEEIKPGAGRNSISQKYRPDIKCLFDHKSGQVQGSTKANTFTLIETNDGLDGTCTPPSVTEPVNLMESIDRGDIDSASFGFFYVTTKWRQEDKFDILEVWDFDMIEASVVSFPAFTATQIGIRSYLEAQEISGEHKPLLCRAFNRLENKLDMNETDKSILTEYSSLLYRSLDEPRKITLSSLVAERSFLAPGVVQSYVDAQRYTLP